MNISPLALGLLFAVAQPAHAEDVQPKPADLQARLRKALGPLGGDEAITEKQVRVTQVGESLEIAVPLEALRGNRTAPEPGPDVVVNVRKRDGHWLIDSITSPPKGNVIASLPDGAVSKETTSVGEQGGNGVFDPSFESRSIIHFAARDVSNEKSDPRELSTLHVDDYAIDASIVSKTVHSLAIEQRLKASNCHGGARPPSPRPGLVSMSSVEESAYVPGISKSDLSSLAMSLGRVVFNIKPEQSASSVTPWIGFVTPLLNGFVGGGKASFSISELSVVDDTRHWGVQRFSLDLGSVTPDRLVSTHADMLIDGLRLPDLPQAAAFVPNHIASHLTLSGMDIAALREFVRTGFSPSPNGRDLATQANLLLASGAPKVSIDELKFDTGEATFVVVGSADVHALAPQDAAGAIRVTAENFDGLIRQLQAQGRPDVAGIVPGLIYAKGLAENEGGKLVWNIAYASGKLTVNGVDPSPQQGAMPPGPPPVQPPAKR